MNSNDNKILSHTQWNCKYHIVFAPKYRRKIFYESHRKAIMQIIRELCEWKKVEILEGEMAIDHVHLLVMVPPKISISGFMGYLKGKSSLIIYQKFGTAKFKYRCREFWCRGYYVDTVAYFYGHLFINYDALAVITTLGQIIFNNDHFSLIFEFVINSYSFAALGYPTRSSFCISLIVTVFKCLVFKIASCSNFGEI